MKRNRYRLLLSAFQNERKHVFESMKTLIDDNCVTEKVKQKFNFALKKLFLEEKFQLLL
jgi:hypothetical protein